MSGAETSLVDRLQHRGWRLTAQRRVIAEILSGQHVHRTADQVLSAARERLPGMSVATVYNTLNELVAMGEIREVSGDGGPRRYDPNVTQPHQHLVCVGCGEMLDVHASDFPRLPEGERHGFEILDVDVTFRGRCQACGQSAHPERS